MLQRPHPADTGVQGSRMFRGPACNGGRAHPGRPPTPRGAALTTDLLPRQPGGHLASHREIRGRQGLAFPRCSCALYILGVSSSQQGPVRGAVLLFLCTHHKAETPPDSGQGLQGRPQEEPLARTPPSSKVEPVHPRTSEPLQSKSPGACTGRRSQVEE